MHGVMLGPFNPLKFVTGGVKKAKNVHCISGPQMAIFCPKIEIFGVFGVGAIGSHNSQLWYFWALKQVFFRHPVFEGAPKAIMGKSPMPLCSLIQSDRELMLPDQLSYLLMF